MPFKPAFQSLVRLLILFAAIVTSIAAVIIVLEVCQIDQLRQAILTKSPTSVAGRPFLSPTVTPVLPTVITSPTAPVRPTPLPTMLSTTIPTSTPFPYQLLEGEFIATQVWTGGDDITIQSDIDSDGPLETIVLGHDHPNGIKLEIINGEEIYSLGSDIAGLDQNGEIPDGQYCQLAIVDVTRNGRFDILLAVGGMLDSELTIWEFDTQKWENTRRGTYINPVMPIAHIEGQTSFRIMPEGIIEMPYGSVGRYNEVVWDGATFAPRP